MHTDKREATETAAKADMKSELTGIPVKVPSAAKYKKHRHEKQNGPDIHVGKRAVIAAQRLRSNANRDGYYLGELVDWFEPHEHGFWTHQTDLIFRVIKSSNSKIPQLEGRLIVARGDGNWWSGTLSVTSWREEDFPVRRG
jgi:hypothetical protein